MSEVKRIGFLDRGSVDGHITIDIAKSEPWSITVVNDGEAVKTYAGPDLFESLKMLRADYESRGSAILVKGSRPDVFPSRMSRSMGGGRKAYLVEIGKSADLNSLIDIFDPEDSTNVNSVVAQEQFAHKWEESLSQLNT